MVDIAEDELAALRQQAAEAIPWRAEAVRLAEALYRFSPNHILLKGEIWVEHFKQREKKV